MSHRINATFRTILAAEAILTELELLGVTEEQISVIMNDNTRKNGFNIESHTKATEGTSVGVAAGGVIGAILGGLATATALAIPGLNIVVSGALVSALAGLGAGAATGGLIGGLIGAGMTEHEAKLYEGEIKDGAILISVSATDAAQKDHIKKMFERENAHNIAA